MKATTYTFMLFFSSSWSTPLYSSLSISKRREGKSMRRSRKKPKPQQKGSMRSITVLSRKWVVSKRRQIQSIRRTKKKPKPQQKGCMRSIAVFFAKCTFLEKKAYPLFMIKRSDKCHFAAAQSPFKLQVEARGINFQLGLRNDLFAIAELRTQFQKPRRLGACGDPGEDQKIFIGSKYAVAALILQSLSCWLNFRSSEN